MNLIALHLIVLQLLTPLSAEVNKLYDNEDIVAEYDNTGAILRSYIHGQGIDEPVRMTDASTSSNYFYLSDGLSSIIQIQDSSKNTVETYICDSFGTPTIKDSTGTTITQSAIGNPYMFTAREYDSETGLYYYRARYYDAGTGRFLSEDPILAPYYYEGKFRHFFYPLKFNPHLFNQYAYLSNNPINGIDPFGLFNWKKFAKCMGCHAAKLAYEIAKTLLLPFGCSTDRMDYEFDKRNKECLAKYCAGGFDDDDDDDEYTPGTFYPPVPVPNPGGFYPPVPVGVPYSVIMGRQVK